ncbi:Sec-independent protein translocase protein TatA [Bosea sp. 62]|uniref:twin-arginine translocase TatA/TatE family subunit n=1 Tax=unclassified Bosea (in: a-proteobacteria) TaxID=2653178 RepID=UPI00125914E4|nr:MULTISPECIES: twin-arginine translocase TatA/TatE family subunit [unclassified Bosea (in: a-proteobacteria)]CAD5263767.1 Sec-independent protein translocase protein TatA [Bosea sp. 46]CAD5266045.1 Sec-independent protein translocase protein TatA [Bosea sp. 21B]CAD5273652.1 Sec-independent protein translocase protein TatA [Bosea sp. 7B]VVT56625.1 Sec-independent protein translocase protein TatA [Bosea sp. EC-HK365B]VXB78408.1 Sec-independent protein translocase protein TatA [Bosea sp. 29B]
MGGVSIWHWIVVGVIVMLLFGRGKVSELMGDVAKGIKSFKKGMAEDETPPAAQQPADPKVIDQTAQTASPQPAKAETKA